MDCFVLGYFREQSQGQVLSPHPGRSKATGRGHLAMGAASHRNQPHSEAGNGVNAR